MLFNIEESSVTSDTCYWHLTKPWQTITTFYLSLPSSAETKTTNRNLNPNPGLPLNSISQAATALHTNVFAVAIDIYTNVDNMGNFKVILNYSKISDNSQVCSCQPAADSHSATCGSCPSKAEHRMSLCNKSCSIIKIPIKFPTSVTFRSCKSPSVNNECDSICFALQTSPLWERCGAVSKLRTEILKWRHDFKKGSSVKTATQTMTVYWWRGNLTHHLLSSVLMLFWISPRQINDGWCCCNNTDNMQVHLVQESQHHMALT